MSSLKLFDSSEKMIDSLIESIFEEISRAKNLLYKPLVVCPNGNVKNYIILRMANNPRYKIATGIEFTIIETILKKIFLPGQKLIDETIFGLYALTLLKAKNSEFKNIQSVVRAIDNTISTNKLFNISLALSSLIMKYQKELGENWKNVVQINKSTFTQEELFLYKEVKEMIGKKRLKHS